MRKVSALIVLALAMLAGRAHADVTFASGGPKDPSQRANVIDSLGTSRAYMTPCFAKAPPPTVQVTISVAADGSVTTAKAKTKGAAAQCAAGLLAVATFPATGARWTAVLAIPTAGAAGNDAALQGELTKALGSHGAELRRCQDADPSASGPASITMRILPDGSIRDVSVASKLGAKVDACLVRTLEAISLATFTGAPVRYTLALSFAGGGKAGKKPGTVENPVATSDDAPVGAASRGPLEPAQIRDTLDRSKVAIQRCNKAGLNGRLLLRFTVRKDGTVKNLAIKESTLTDKMVSACVLKLVEGLAFPLAPDETLVTFPFTFAGK